MARQRRPRELDISPDSKAKLEEHDLSKEDAELVFDRGPVWVWQPSRVRSESSSTLAVQPGRWRMIGPSDSGTLLTFILEAPDDTGTSWVVTGFEATGRDQARYHQQRRRRS